MVTQTTLPNPEAEREGALVGPREMKPFASPEWCWQTIELLKVRFARKRDTAEMFEQTLRELEESRAWERVPPNRPYGSEEALLRAELGVKSASEAVTAKRVQQAAQETTGEILPEGRPTYNETAQFAQLSQAERAGRASVSRRTQQKLDRLASNFPALHERVKRGELSANRASIEAGFVKPVVTVPLDPERAARILAKHFDVMALIDCLARLASKDE